MEINLTGIVVVVGNYGSGKTEVYLRLIEAVLARQQQALVLVPALRPLLAQ